MTNCLVVQHVAPESSWAIGNTLDSAGSTPTSGARSPAMPSPRRVGLRRPRRDGRADVGALRRRLPHPAGRAGAAAPMRSSRRPDAGRLPRRPAAGPRRRRPGLPRWHGPRSAGGRRTATDACRDDPLFAGFPAPPHRAALARRHLRPAPGAHHLAPTPRYANQAFRVGDAAWGLQFHIEVTRGRRRLPRCVPAEPPAPRGRRRHAGADARRRLPRSAPWRDLVFDRFAALVGGAAAASVAGRSPHGFADISGS